MAARIDPLTRIAYRPGSCWDWTGPRDPNGYGRHGASLAHRLIYMLLVGGLGDRHLDHLCRNPSCVNPMHLDPVTHDENVRRGIAGAVNAARQQALTHCKHGHAFDDANTGLDRRGYRVCRACSRGNHNGYANARRDAGVCVRCGAPSAGRSLCEQHRQKHKERRTMKNKDVPILLRQGDVLLASVEGIPSDAKEVPRGKRGVVLAEGEVTGHAHRIPSRAATLYRTESDARFMRVTAPVALNHEEHTTVKIPVGDYRVTIHAEYQPGELPRQVAD